MGGRRIEGRPASCRSRNGVFLCVKRNSGQCAGAVGLFPSACAADAPASSPYPAVALQILPQGGATAASPSTESWGEGR